MQTQLGKRVDEAEIDHATREQRRRRKRPGRQAAKVPRPKKQ